MKKIIDEFKTAKEVLNKELSLFETTDYLLYGDLFSISKDLIFYSEEIIKNIEQATKIKKLDPEAVNKSDIEERQKKWILELIDQDMQKYIYSQAADALRRAIENFALRTYSFKELVVRKIDHLAGFDLIDDVDKQTQFYASLEKLYNKSLRLYGYPDLTKIINENFGDNSAIKKVCKFRGNITHASTIEAAFEFDDRVFSVTERSNLFKSTDGTEFLRSFPPALVSVAEVIRMLRNHKKIEYSSKDALFNKHLPEMDCVCGSGKKYKKCCGK